MLIVFTIEFNLFLPCFGLSTLYCTCAYTEKGDPTRWPGITQQWYQHGAGVSDAPFPLALLLYFFYGFIEQ